MRDWPERTSSPCPDKERTWLLVPKDIKSLRPDLVSEDEESDEVESPQRWGSISFQDVGMNRKEAFSRARPYGSLFFSANEKACGGKACEN
jgi:hypothetical protein